MEFIEAPKAPGSLLQSVKGPRTKGEAQGNWHLVGTPSHWLSIFTNSDDSHGEGLLTVVCHYVVKGCDIREALGLVGKVPGLVKSYP